MPQMTAPSLSWHHESLFEWSDLFIIGSSLDPNKEIEGVTQLVDTPIAPIIPHMYAQEMSTDIGEGPS